MNVFKTQRLKNLLMLGQLIYRYVDYNWTDSCIFLVAPETKIPFMFSAYRYIVHIIATHAIEFTYTYLWVKKLELFICEYISGKDYLLLL